MFSTGARAAIDLAKDIAVTRDRRPNEARLEIDDLAAAISAETPGADWLAALLYVSVEELQRRYPIPEALGQCATSLTMSPAFRQLLTGARTLAGVAPLAEAAVLIGLAHLAAATAAVINGTDVTTAPAELEQWVVRENQSRLAAIDRQLRGMRRQLLSKVFGQDHAVAAFVEALFGIELIGAADQDRAKPAGLFVFAGPPGVGKTHLAELAAKILQRPFRRFDMTGFAQEHEVGTLIGTPPAYRGAAPGTLTQFVKEHPNGVLLFDEIEKAHRSAIHLFLQVLEAGRLEDRNTEETVIFRDCLIIFTTNAGRALYEAAGSTGVSLAHRDYHRATILEALQNETDPRTGVPYFPTAICSRMGSGYPILFRPLGIPELVRVARDALEHTAGLLGQSSGKRFEIADEIPLALVLREGGQTDARMVKARAERFLKDELFEVCGLIGEQQLAATLAQLQKISVELDTEHELGVAEDLFAARHRPRVLVAERTGIGTTLPECLPDINWNIAGSADAALAFLEGTPVDAVLVDLSIPESGSEELGDITDPPPSLLDESQVGFAHASLASQRFLGGQRFLKTLRERLPELPIYLLTIAEPGSVGAKLDDELLLACMRAGGARGHLHWPIAIPEAEGPWSRDLDYEAFAPPLRRVLRELRMETIAREMARRRQAFDFDVAPALSADGEKLRLRCRNFRRVTTLHSSDASAVLADIERPTTRFDDVVGAISAKSALLFIRNWLDNADRYAALGVEPPRGVLLTGVPGTGKTMLARALAGESECAFVSIAATNFVTIWQGSGPENIRALFNRARRYAPAIIFIDEIDAIGRQRASRPGAGHGEEMALNALLMELDGFARRGSRPVIVIAATNTPELLDPALVRRFDRVIEVELPTRSERHDYIVRMLARRPRHAVGTALITRLAGQAYGMSIADLERVFAEAAMIAVTQDGLVDDTILAEAFEKIRFGERREGGDGLRTARHEAGHALVMSLTGEPPIYVTTVGRGAFGGYAAADYREGIGCYSVPQLEDRMCHLLAGREAERHFYGERDGLSTGAGNDLRRATNLAESMVYDYGMADEVGLMRVDRDRLGDSLRHSCEAAISRLLREQAARAAAMLRDNATTLDAIVKALAGEGRLTQEALLALLPPHKRAAIVEQKGS